MSLKRSFDEIMEQGRAPKSTCRFLQPSLCRILFGIDRKSDLDDDDYLERCQFVSGVVMGSGWKLKHHIDLLQFNQTFWPHWQALYARFLKKGGFEDPEWPIYDFNDSTLCFKRFEKDGVGPV
jgi:hypothetical protein